MRAGALAAALGLLAALAGPGAAQDPDSLPAPAPVPQDSVRTAPAAPGAYTPPRVAVSVMVGTLGFGELQRQGVTAEVLDAGGAVLGTDTLTRILGAGDGLQVGASALLGLSGPWALRGAISWGRGTLEAGYAGDEPVRGDAAGVEVPTSADFTVLSAEGALRYRLLSRRRLQPYMELGVAAVRVEAEDAAHPGAGDLDGETSLGALAAVGAIVPLVGPVSGRIQASGHFFRTPAAPAPAGGLAGAADTLRLTFQDPAVGPFADRAVELTRTLRLELGLSVGIGSAGRRTVAPDARTSVPRP